MILKCLILMMAIIHSSLADTSIITPSIETTLTAQRGQNVTFQWYLNVPSNLNLSGLILTTTPYISTALRTDTVIWRQDINTLTNEGKNLFENRLTVSKTYLPNFVVTIENSNVKDSLKFKFSGMIVTSNSTERSFSSTITVDIKGEVINVAFKSGLVPCKETEVIIMVSSRFSASLPIQGP